jgi:hypothetical protein
MAIVNFSNLDFDQIKESIIEYLRAKSNFTDYDFEGSNLSILIDTLAYNTYLTSYNANMLSNEVFIDGATLRENVVSLARNIGYVPRSITSTRANVSFFVDIANLSINNVDSTNRPLTLTLQKGTVCTTQTFGRESYTFTVIDNITVPVIDNIASFDNVEIVEGTPVTETFTVNSSIPNQKIVLSNPNIDTSTLNVYVRDESGSSVVRKFNLSKSLFDIDSKSKVFFIQEVEDQRYELIFGDGIFGKKLDNGNVIEVTYNISNGPTVNGASSFNYVGRIIDNEGRLITSNISSVTTNVPAYGGKDIESVEYVRKYAPRIYAAQNRAVTSTDYESIIPKIYSEVESVSVFGGEELNPPRYGRVFISIKPINGPYLSNYIKDNIKRELRKYNVAGIVPEILDLKYLYIEYDSTIYYNSNLARSSSEVLDIVSKNIESYSKSSELNSYGSRFKYSKFQKLIDDSNISITSNITKIKMRRDLRTEVNRFADYEICYGNQFHIASKSGFNIKSSGFSVSGISGTVYMTDIPDNDFTGKIILFKVQENTYKIIRKNIGTIDYEKGEIKLYPLNILNTVKKRGSDNIIEISASPKSNDIIGLQDLYLQIDINNSNLTALEDTISSGNDISGTNYNSTSSYTNSSLIRK